MHDRPQLSGRVRPQHASVLSEILQTQLSQLIGARLVAAGRAANLQHFTFLVGDGREFFLHVECPWRITDGSQIIAGNADYWRPATSEVSEEALDAGEIGATLRDLRNEALRERIGLGLRVVAVRVDRFGGFVLDFDAGLRIETFPDASPVAHDEWEFWRLFPRGGPHFVVSSRSAYIST